MNRAGAIGLLLGAKHLIQKWAGSGYIHTVSDTVSKLRMTLK